MSSGIAQRSMLARITALGNCPGVELSSEQQVVSSVRQHRSRKMEHVRNLAIQPVHKENTLHTPEK